MWKAILRVMAAYDGCRQKECLPFTFLIQCEEIYGNAGDGCKIKLMPLGRIGGTVE